MAVSYCRHWIKNSLWPRVGEVSRPARTVVAIISGIMNAEMPRFGHGTGDKSNASQTLGGDNAA
jgi:hypothetical protein